MSKYTTGELAKLCGVSVRTVQYYDERGVLFPSALSEGGRRLYSEEDLKRMRSICFLRSMDIPLNGIKTLMAEDNIENILDVMLTQQEKGLREELEKLQQQLQTVQSLKAALKTVDQLSVESIGDIACIMENKKKLKRLRWTILVLALIAETIEIGTVILWVRTGIWWPLVAYLPVLLVMVTWISAYYYRQIAYICPQCHEVFKPKFQEMFWANHTPNTRKLCCPHCGHKGYCVEVHADALQKQ